MQFKTCGFLFSLALTAAAIAQAPAKPAEPTTKAAEPVEACSATRTMQDGFTECEELRLMLYQTQAGAIAADARRNEQDRENFIQKIMPNHPGLVYQPATANTPMGSLAIPPVVAANAALKAKDRAQLAAEEKEQAAAAVKAEQAKDAKKAPTPPK